VKKFIVAGEGLPAWNAPISHAVVVDNLCFVSGQLSIDDDGRYLPGTPRDETTLAFRNVFAALGHAGFAPEDICFVQIDLADLADMPDLNEVFAELFDADRRPARTVAQAAGLPYGAKVKVVVTAARERGADETGAASSVGMN
jgi:2-iminobutanoate/2-iminopropanoate deaminase